MTEPTDELLIKLSADVSGLVASMNKAGETIDNLASHASKTMEGSFVSGFIKGEVVVELLKKALESLKEMTYDTVKEQYEQIDAMTLMSERTGIATEDLAAMEVLGHKVGATMDDYSLALRRLSVVTKDAADDTSQAYIMLKTLGLTFEELRRESPDKQLALIGQALNQIKDPMERTALATELLGRGGAKVALSMRDGAEGLRQAREEAEKTGKAFSLVDGETIRQSNIAIIEMKDLFEGIARQLAIASAPFITVIADEMKRAVGETHGFRDEFAALADDVSGVAGFIGNVWHALTIAFDVSRTVIYAIADAFNGVMAQGSEAAETVKNIWNRAGEFFKDLADVIVSYFGNAWALIKNAFGALAADLNEQAAQMLDAFANAAGHVSNSMKEQIAGAAAAMRANGKAFADGMKSDLDKSNAEVEKATNKLASVWDGLQPKADQYWAHVTDTSDKMVKEAMAKLAAVVDAEWPGTAIDKWCAKLQSEVHAAAVKAAADVKKNMNGGAEGDQTKKLTQDEEKQLQVIAKSLRTRYEIEDEEYTKEHLLLLKAQDLDKKDKEKYRKEDEILEKQHLKRYYDAKAAAIKTGVDLEKFGWDATAAYALNQMNDDLQNLQTHSKQMFEIKKAAALATAIVNTAEAATAAYADTPYPYNFVAAAAVIAAGAVQIANIASQSFSGGGSSGGGSAGAPALPPPGNGSGLGGNAKEQRSISIQVTGSKYTRQDVMDLIKQINTAVGDGATLKAT